MVIFPSSSGGKVSSPHTINWLWFVFLKSLECCFVLWCIYIVQRTLGKNLSPSKSAKVLWSKVKNLPLFLSWFHHILCKCKGSVFLNFLFYFFAYRMGRRRYGNANWRGCSLAGMYTAPSYQTWKQIWFFPNFVSLEAFLSTSSDSYLELVVL